MKTTAHRTAGARATAWDPTRAAQRRLEALLRAMPRGPQDMFTDREEDAAEYDSIVRDFTDARDEALSAERYN